MEEGGLKSAKKSVTYYLNGLLIQFTLQFSGSLQFLDLLHFSAALLEAFGVERDCHGKVVPVGLQGGGEDLPVPH